MKIAIVYTGSKIRCTIQQFHNLIYTINITLEGWMLEYGQ